MRWYMDTGQALNSVRLALIRKTHQWGSLSGCGGVKSPRSGASVPVHLSMRSGDSVSTGSRQQNCLIVTTGLKHMEYHRGVFIVSLLHNVCRWTAAPVSRSEEALYIIDYSIPEFNLHSESGNNQRTFVTMVYITVASILVYLVSVFLH
jgi:hypothetical protein